MPDSSTNLSGVPSSTESVVPDSLQIEAEEASSISFHDGQGSMWLIPIHRAKRMSLILPWAVMC